MIGSGMPMEEARYPECGAKRGLRTPGGRRDEACSLQLKLASSWRSMHNLDDSYSRSLHLNGEVSIYSKPDC
jgi:hypothetical protein